VNCGSFSRMLSSNLFFVTLPETERRTTLLPAG